jgi:hypothetical protein
MGKNSACRALVGKPEGNMSLGKLRRGWKNNTEMDLKEIGWKVWRGLVCLRIETSGGLLWTR